MTRQAVGEMSMPIHWRPRFCAATSAVPQPQKASSTMSFGLLLSFDDAFQERKRLLRRITEALVSLCIERADVDPTQFCSGTPLHLVEITLVSGELPAARVDDAAFRLQLLHVFSANTPVPTWVTTLATRSADVALDGLRRQAQVTSA